MLLNDNQVNKEIINEIKKILQLNEHENTAYQKL